MPGSRVHNQLDNPFHMKRSPSKFCSNLRASGPYSNLRTSISRKNTYHMKCVLRHLLLTVDIWTILNVQNRPFHSWEELFH